MKSTKAVAPKQSDAPRTRLTPRNAADLQWEMQEIQLAIARRAYELFEARGCEHGHDGEDWFRAESELLRPVAVAVSETDDRISVRVNVFGFEEKELKVSVEPRCITILGKKETIVTESEGGKVEYIDWYPDHVLKLIDLAAEVVPESSLVELQAGLLSFELSKATVQKAGPELETKVVAA